MLRPTRCFALVPILFLAALLVAGCGETEEEVVARGEPAVGPGASATASGDPAAGSAPDGDTDEDDADGVALPTASSGGVVVDVAGAVRNPGVYRLEPGARVHEAIQAAGGARRGAQLGALNRAAALVDGQQVLVLGPGSATGGASAAGSGGGAAAAAGTGGAPGGLVNINSADVAALDALPGIGEVTASKIVADRAASGPFATIDDLDRVAGIGPATIESLRAVATA